MILEVATLSIHEGQQNAFEAAFPDAAAILASADGYVSHELQRCVENDSRFILLVRWKSVAHHMQGFRQSALFAHWRAILSRYFSTPPSVEHYFAPGSGPDGAAGSAVGDAALDVFFRRARTQNRWTERAVPEEALRRLYETFKWGPTSFNGSPARVVFCRSEAARQQLADCAAKGNQAKILSAPVTAIIGYDLKFYDQLPLLAAGHSSLGVVTEMYRSNAALAQETAFRNGSLQGAYLMLAARALGLDCGPMSGFDNARVDGYFFGASGYRSNFICSLGYADPSGAYPRAARLPFAAACELR